MKEGRGIDYRFKILYAIAIIMVVCGHTRGGGVTILNDWFPYGALHLPIFAFSSGYFYKNSSEKHPLRYILKKIKTLVIPLYLYTIVYGLIVQFMRSKGFEMGGTFTLKNVLIAPIINGHQFTYNLGGWFLAPLFMLEISNLIIRKVLRFFYKKMPEIIFLIISIVLGIAGIKMAIAGYNHDWWLALVRMLYFMPFFGMGTFYNRVLEKYERKIPSFWLFAVIFAVKLGIGVHYVKMPEYYPAWCREFPEGPVMPIIVGYLGIFLWMRIATILEPAIGRSRPVNLIANSTFSIMMNQFLGFMIVKTIYAFFNKSFAMFPDFDWAAYKTDLFWYYIPRGLKNTLILYVFGGIAFSLAVQFVLNKVKSICLGIMK